LSSTPKLYLLYTANFKMCNFKRPSCKCVGDFKTQRVLISSSLDLFVIPLRPFVIASHVPVIKPSLVLATLLPCAPVGPHCSLRSDVTDFCISITNTVVGPNCSFIAHIWLICQLRVLCGVEYYGVLLRVCFLISFTKSLPKYVSVLRTPTDHTRSQMFKITQKVRFVFRLEQS
jgi:hypothetical protein